MKHRHTKKILIVLSILMVLLGIFNIKSGSEETNSTEEFKRGPHNGRLLEDENLDVEVTIFEPEGVPPKFRIYFYKNGEPISPKDITYEMQLQRINRVEKIPFKEQGAYLESIVEACEPHSFKVNIHAACEGKQSDWEYESYEGRVELNQEALDANHIKIEEAEIKNFEVKLDVMGKIIPNEELTVYISPRFPGVVKAVNKKLGDSVRKGETLALIESNESMRDYEIKSEIDGMIIKKNINLGMYLNGEENIFVISDINSVWADFNICCQNLPHVKIGDAIQIKSLDGSKTATSTISYISPVGDEDTQTVTLRSVMPNVNLEWKVGLFISGEITVEKIQDVVTIKKTALQTLNNGNVVFIAVGNVFEAVPVELGKVNKEWVEITSGLSKGDKYVSENSFILKADVGKSGAAHDH